MILNDESIPKILKDCYQWVVWRHEERDGKSTKVPYKPITNERASTTDPDTWTKFQRVLYFANNGHNYDGIGFVFSRDDKFCGIDLDHVVKDGEIEAWALDIINRMDSYSEFSPSGTGVHIIVQAELPGKTGKKKEHIEMYSWGRYFTVTGNHVPGTPLTVENRQAELDQLYNELFVHDSQSIREQKQTENPQSIVEGDDDALLEMARRTKNRDKFIALFDDGDTANYGCDDSDADLALCNILAFWCGPDAERIDRLFRRSALYRPKWEREDYRQQTIQKAIDQRHESSCLPCISNSQPSSNTIGTSLQNQSGQLTSIGSSKYYPTEINPEKPMIKKPNRVPLIKMEAEIANIHRDSNGPLNNTLYNAASRLAIFVASGDLNENVVQNQLLMAAIDAKLPEQQAKATIRSGLAAGMERSRTISSSFSQVQDKASDLLKPNFIPIGEFTQSYPKMRPPVISGLLRIGEIMNLIGPPKSGKSWLINNLIVSMLTGTHWLGHDTVRQAKVLVIDNELHPETLSERLNRVAQAQGVDLKPVKDYIFIESLRGKLQDIKKMNNYFDAIEPGRFDIIVLDAFYRFLPAGFDENSNTDIAAAYNILDSYARRLNSAFLLVHHSTKGGQTNKSVTDVGAGAGAQSRAADTHVILRPHEEENCYVLDAVARSWPPITPKVLRFTFPLWHLEPDLDPSRLQKSATKRDKNESNPKPSKPVMTAEIFVNKFISEEPKPKAAIIANAVKEEMSRHLAEQLLREADANGLISRINHGANKPIEYSLKPKP